MRLLQWFVKHWLVLSERVLLVGLAILLWAIAYPSIDQTHTFEFHWVMQVWVINLLLMIVSAGGLHLWFPFHTLEIFISITKYGCVNRKNRFGV